jgi:membrane protein
MTLAAEAKEPGGRVPLRHIHPWKLLKEGCLAFVADNALTRGAAIAFYAVTAIAPVLFIATTVAGLFLGQNAAIVHVMAVHHTVLGSLIGLATLVITASGVFTEMEDALNVIWKAPRKESYLYQVLRGRVMSFVLVIGLGILLMMSMILAAGIGVLARHLGQSTSLGPLMIGAVNMGLSLLLVSLLFAAIYKILPNTPLLWRDVTVGAVGTAILFEAGQALISIYLTRFISANIYGAAAGVIVLLVWVYYSAQIFLLGAEFTKVWAHHYGSQQNQPP